MLTGTSRVSEIARSQHPKGTRIPTPKHHKPVHLRPSSATQQRHWKAFMKK